MKRSTIVLCCVALLAWGCGGGGSNGDSGNDAIGKVDTVTGDAVSDANKPMTDEKSPDDVVTVDYKVDKSCLQFFGVQHEVWYGPPANVMAFFRVENCEEKPVPGLAIEDFTIEDDGQAMSPFESFPNLVPAKIGFKMYTVLLLDMSGSILSADTLPKLIESAEAFIRELVENPNLTMEVAVYFFDGRKDIVQLADFSNDADALATAVQSLVEPECETNDDCPSDNGYCIESRCIDPSTNLHGAIINGLQVLDSKKALVDPTMIRQGYLAVFTDGSDQAHYPEFYGKAQAAVDGTDNAVFSIGLGGEIDQAELISLGKDGAKFAEDQAAVEGAFKVIATEVVAQSQSYYILGYCSPRKGEADHTVEVSILGSTGQYTFDYNSGVFGGGACSPEQITEPCKNIECGQSAWLNCGTCDACGTECVEGSCTVTACEGKACGDDGCGGNCGECGPEKPICYQDQCFEECPPTVCQVGDLQCAGTEGYFVCIEVGPPCEGVNVWDDVPISCAPDEECVHGECKCMPDCEGKECGDDGCGGSCGECPDGLVCEEHQCVEVEDVCSTSGYDLATGEFCVDDSTLALWHFNGNANTEVGPYNGTVSGAQLVPGKFGEAYQFSGGQDISTSQSVVGDEPISIEFWFKPETDQSSGIVVHLGCFWMQFGYDGAGKLAPQDSGGGTKYISQAEYGSNDWHYVAFTVGSSGDMHLYVDGLEDGNGESGWGDVFHADCGNLTIGSTGGSHYFIGTIDELRISNVARSPDNVKAYWEFVSAM